MIDRQKIFIMIGRIEKIRQEVDILEKELKEMVE